MALNLETPSDSLKTRAGLEGDNALVLKKKSRRNDQALAQLINGT
jgi:hypothetical protein